MRAAIIFGYALELVERKESVRKLVVNCGKLWSPVETRVCSDGRVRNGDVARGSAEKQVETSSNDRIHLRSQGKL